MMTAYIFKHRGQSADGPLGNFSSKTDEVTVVSEGEGLNAAQTGLVWHSRSPAVIVVQRVVCGKPYLTAYPCDKDGKPDTSRMAGGCFIYSCDSRFRSQFGDYPIPLHDRKE
jgi:hypothetical protein